MSSRIDARRIIWHHRIAALGIVVAVSGYCVGMFPQSAGADRLHGGLTYRDLRSLLHHTARRGRVVGFDIVELDAPHDVTGATSRVTTWLMVHFLSSIFDAR
jgi:hypothetical protein